MANILYYWVSINHRRTEGGGQGREIISRLSNTITQEIFENMYVFFLIDGGGGRGEKKAIVNFILVLLTKLYQ